MVKARAYGFTIVELLIVIVVIAILAAITIAAFNAVTTRAQNSKIASDLTEIDKAILSAEQNTGKTLLQIAPPNPNCGTGGAATCCLNYGTWTQPPANCLSASKNALAAISSASGINIQNMVDPWGNPYAIMQLESSTDCRQDQLWADQPPINGWSTVRLGTITLPFSGNSNC